MWNLNINCGDRQSNKKLVVEMQVLQRAETFILEIRLKCSFWNIWLNLGWRFNFFRVQLRESWHYYFI